MTCSSRVFSSEAWLSFVKLGDPRNWEWYVLLNWPSTWEPQIREMHVLMWQQAKVPESVCCIAAWHLWFPRWKRLSGWRSIIAKASSLITWGALHIYICLSCLLFSFLPWWCLSGKTNIGRFYWFYMILLLYPISTHHLLLYCLYFIFLCKVHQSLAHTIFWFDGFIKIRKQRWEANLANSNNIWGQINLSSLNELQLIWALKNPDIWPLLGHELSPSTPRF